MSNKTNEVEEIISRLPMVKGSFNRDIWLYEGAYYGALSLSGVMRMQHHYKPNSQHILIASFPKTGFTWLKSLVFAIINRSRYKKEAHPLLTKISHEFIPVLEMWYSTNYAISSPSPDQDCVISEPILVSTHVPYTTLPRSFTDSASKLVYICRDPKDVFVSFWHFASKLFPQNELSDDERFSNDYRLFCDGLCPNGPYWDHVLSYWKASIQKSEKVMFLKYEDIKSQPQFNVKKIAEFLGQPFTLEEEKNGEVQHIVDLCSFESLSGLEVNKTGVIGGIFKYEAYYRKGEVGDWKNHLTQDMVDHMDEITKQKLDGSGLTF